MTHDDDKFEAFLEREAKRYNAPPAEVPRDAMWDVIAKARADRAERAARAGGEVVDVKVVPMPSRRPRYTQWMGMAATLLVGVAIGRYVMTPRVVDAPVGDPALTQAPLGAPAAPGAGDSAPAATPVAGPAVSGGAPAFIRHTSEPRAPRVAALNAPGSAARDGSNSTYTLASQRHLSRAEALVAVVSAMPQDAMMDSLTARWAKDVLTNTRLLLDSPAGDDPVRRRLLEDLETVLVQLVQRSGRAAEDRELLDRTLQKTQLLTRLRSRAAGT